MRCAIISRSGRTEIVKAPKIESECFVMVVWRVDLLRKDYLGLFKGGGCSHWRRSRFLIGFSDKKMTTRAQKGVARRGCCISVQKRVHKTDYLLKWLWIDNTSGIIFEYSTLVFPDWKTNNKKGRGNQAINRPTHCVLHGLRWNTNNLFLSIFKSN